MIVNRMQDLREARGMTLEQLAAAVRSSKTTVQALEQGNRALVHKLVEPIAKALGVDWIELLTMPAPPAAAAPARGFAESAAAFKPAPGHELHGIKLGPLESLFQVRDESMAAIGIHKGDLLLVDVSAKAVRGIQTGDTVIAQVYGPGLTDAVTIVREYIAPSLLITNPGTGTIEHIDLTAGAVDAAIKGVASRRYGALRKPG